MTTTKTTQQGSDALLQFLIDQASSGNKNWFGFHQQRVLGINIAYRIAERHANTMSPEAVADYAMRLNNAIYSKLVKEQLS